MDGERHPVRLRGVWAKALGLMIENEARGVDDDYLDGLVLSMKVLLADELTSEEHKPWLDDWNEAAKRVEEARNGAERKRARLDQAEVLHSLAKRVGLALDRDLYEWELDSFKEGRWEATSQRD